MRGIVVLGIVLLGLSACSEDKPIKRLDLIKSEFTQWVEKNDINSATLAISKDGELVGQVEINRNADEAYPIASLSKFITGACIDKLVRNGKISYDLSVKSVVSELDSDATISELLTHTSGYKKDVTQSNLDFAKSRREENLISVSKQELKELRGDKKHHYNNSNYAMLGAIIAESNTSSYEDACQKFIFKPLNINTAELNPDWRIMSSWGGWKISAQDMVVFLDNALGHDTIFGKMPSQLPNTKLSESLFYGPGIVYRNGRNGGVNFWHFGGWDWRHDEKKEAFGAHFVKFDNGWTLVSSYNVVPGWDAFGDLDRRLAESTHKKLGK